MTTENDERTRIAAIMRCDAGKKLPTLSETLALGTDLPTAAVMAILAAAASDLNAATGDREAPAPRRPYQTANLGLGMPDSTEARQGHRNAAAGWGKAIANANRGVESLIGGGEKPNSGGWSRAVSAANRQIA